MLPVYEGCRLVDLLAISRHDHTVWGCVTGAGQSIGNPAAGRKDRSSPLRIYRTPVNWLLNNCEGILPLAKSFFPLLQNAKMIIAEGYEHACDISEYAFARPAEQLYFDYEEAEIASLSRIAFEVAE